MMLRSLTSKSLRYFYLHSKHILNLLWVAGWTFLCDQLFQGCTMLALSLRRSLAYPESIIEANEGVSNGWRSPSPRLVIPAIGSLINSTNSSLPKGVSILLYFYIIVYMIYRFHSLCQFHDRQLAKSDCQLLSRKLQGPISLPTRFEK
jgi:hypothetical protein